MTNYSSISERAAYHEAGHAVILRRFRRNEFQHSHIILTASGEGLIQSFQPTHNVPATPPLTDHQKCLVAMAGRAAEQIQYPELSYDEVNQLSLGDEEWAQELIRQSSEDNISDDDIPVRTISLLNEAREILYEDWAAVLSLVDRLIMSPAQTVCLDGGDALRLMDAALMRSASTQDPEKSSTSARPTKSTMNS